MDTPEQTEAEVKRLQAEVQSSRSENNKLKAEVADRQFQSELLDKQVRKLERKIAALEDKRKRNGATEAKGLVRGFLQKCEEANPGYSAAFQDSTEKPRTLTTPWPGAILDAETGLEIDPATFWPQEQNKDDIIRRSLDQCPEAELMHEMRNPPEVNSDFDNRRYAALVASGQSSEAEEMIRTQSGPTPEQMERTPLAILRQHPTLDPNWKDPTLNGCSLLQWACSMGYQEVARELLGRRADVNYRTALGSSSLAAACSANSMACAQLLLASSADPSEVIEPTGRQTLLMWAARVEYSDKEGRQCRNPLLELLLQSKSELHARDAQGQTALMHASSVGHALAVESLLAARAEALAEDSDGHSALQTALLHGHASTAQILMAHQGHT